MKPPAPPSLPPAVADCVTVSQGPQTGAAPPQQYASRIVRSADGKMRVDSGTNSVIMDPSAGRTILLDHVKKEAHIAPMTSPGMPQMPGMNITPPQPPAPPPPIQVQDLGKGFIEGHAVDGKRYIMPPAVAQVPTAPPMPGMPQPPAAPQPPTVSEVWTSSKLQMPVLTKTTGSFGEQTCHCRCAETAEPHPALFQVPPDYKMVVPQAPAPPGPPPFKLPGR